MNDLMPSGNEDWLFNHHGLYQNTGHVIIKPVLLQECPKRKPCTSSRKRENTLQMAGSNLHVHKHHSGHDYPATHAVCQVWMPTGGRERQRPTVFCNGVPRVPAKKWCHAPQSCSISSYHKWPSRTVCASLQVCRQCRYCCYPSTRGS